MIFKRVAILFYLIWSINFIKFLKLLRFRKKAHNCIFILPYFPKYVFKHFMRGDSDYMFAVINSLIENNEPFSIVIGLPNLWKLKDKRIYFIASNLYQYNNSMLSHSEEILRIYKQIHQSNLLFPSYEEMSLWENKINMYEKFQLLNINHPTTFTIDQSIYIKDNDFPIIFKPSYTSGSQGIIEIMNKDSLTTFEKANNIKGVYQKRVKMTKDLRVILINNHICLFYWRINSSNYWKPTSTSHGSFVKFHDFPDHWSEFIINTFKKLKITTGAFDICWPSDDLSQEPYFLEVSPIYLPNPPLPKNHENIPYHEFKRNLIGKKSYCKLYVNILYSLTFETTNCYLNKTNELS